MNSDAIALTAGIVVAFLLAAHHTGIALAVVGIAAAYLLATRNPPE